MASSTRPRRSARRKIPDAAFGLKQYFDRSGRVSKTSDNDDATASLGDSEVLSVQHSVGDAIPAFAQPPEDGTHPPAVECHASSGTGEPPGPGPSSAGSSPNRVNSCDAAGVGAPPPSGAGADARQETGDVLQDEPPGAKAGEEAKDLPDEPRACATQSEAKARQAEVGAGPSSAENPSSGIEPRGDEVIGRYLRDVGEVGGGREVDGRHPGGGTVDLDSGHGRDAGRGEGAREACDAVEEGDELEIGHHHTSTGPPA